MEAHAAQSPEYRRKYSETQRRHEAAETRLAFFPQSRLAR